MKKTIHSFLIGITLIFNLAIAQREFKIFEEKNFNKMLDEQIRTEIEDMKVKLGNIEASNFSAEKKAKETAKAEEYLANLEDALHDREFQTIKLTYEVMMAGQELQNVQNNKPQDPAKLKAWVRALQDSIDKLQELNDKLEPRSNGEPPKKAPLLKSQMTIQELKKRILELQKEFDTVDSEEIASNPKIEPNPRDAWASYRNTLKKEIADLKETLELRTKDEKTNPRGGGDNHKSSGNGTIMRRLMKDKK